MYLHVLRGIFYKRYKLPLTWNLGVTLLLTSILIAFIGYVLPFRNIRLWAATVITNLLGVFPIFGREIVLWLWGDFYVRDKTLKIFFTLHFLLPFLLFLIIIIHLLQLHTTGRNTKKRNTQYFSSIPFVPFGIKDRINLVPPFLLILFTLTHPYYFTESDRYIPSNLLSSPPHITPEWYFLFAYAILRAIPNKIGGVLLLVFRVTILYLFPLAKKDKNLLPQNLGAYSLIIFWRLLTFLGRKGVEFPYFEIRQALTLIYFSTLLLFLFN